MSIDELSSIFEKKRDVIVKQSTGTGTGTF